MNMDPKVNSTGAQWLHAVWTNKRLKFHAKAVFAGAMLLGFIAIVMPL